MNLVGLVLARNEAWILDACLRVALRWCDHVVVVDHDSKDETPRILDDLHRQTGRVHVLRTRDAEWNEMEHRELTLAGARALSATHCAIIDADEILTGPTVRAIRPMVERLPERTILRVPMRALWRSMTTERVDDCVWTRAMMPLAFRLTPDIAWRVAADGYQFHNRVPAGIPHALDSAALDFRGAPFGCFHAQWASWPRVTAKQVWYRMVEHLRWPGRQPPEALNQMYDQALDEAGADIRSVPEYLWDGIASDVLGHVDLTGDPWQRGEIERLWREHGEDAFQGLDLKGLVTRKPKPPVPGNNSTREPTPSKVTFS